MKNIVKEDLLSLKVTIGCKNKLAYQDCAYLVDKPEFLLSLPSLRRKYNINDFIPIDKFDDWWLSKIKDDLDEYGTNGKLLTEAKRLFSNPNNKPSTNEIFESLPYHKRFDLETKLLTRHYQRPGYFHLAIKHAIVCNQVDDSSWEPTYADVIPWELPIDEYLMPEVVVVLSPMTRRNDVLKSFADAKKLFNENKNLRYLDVIKRVKSDEIVRNRRWYWKSLEGKSPGDIYEEEFLGDDSIVKIQENSEEDFQFASISRAVDRYAEILQTI